MAFVRIRPGGRHMVVTYGCILFVFTTLYAGPIRYYGVRTSHGNIRILIMSAKIMFSFFFLADFLQKILRTFDEFRTEK